ncbi:hypothetical protein RN001_007651 [Aquatica leii]|uniref:ATP-dependent Clp protease proteolytic subunit n=1 Tax=Aquatica leii TaxID=1421715 RepID=A0AAN7P368_9COLE|nr:hypothetical protein RN001_007651 [Aquatica leii]
MALEFVDICKAAEQKVEALKKLSEITTFFNAGHDVSEAASASISGYENQPKISDNTLNKTDMNEASLQFKIKPWCILKRNFNMIPIVIEQTGRGERSYDIFSRLLKERIICLMGPINDGISSIIVAQLLFLQAESSNRPIHMYINSPGGNVTSGLSIYDTMQYILPPISTWCVGQACSMASLLLSAGSKGMRYSLPNARIMMHQPSGGVQGQATDIQIQAEEIVKLKKKINNLYVKHTGLELKRIENSIERDKFMNPEEAQDFGLIDKILSSPPKLNHSTNTPVKEINKDEIPIENIRPNVADLLKQNP